MAASAAPLAQRLLPPECNARAESAAALHAESGRLGHQLHMSYQGPSSRLPSVSLFTCILISASKVIGVGGGGGNAVNRMIESVATNDGSSSTVNAVEMWVVNTDAQALSRSLAKNKLNIGSTTSRGLGAGGIPDVLI